VEVGVVLLVVVAVLAVTERATVCQLLLELLTRLLWVVVERERQAVQTPKETQGLILYLVMLLVL
jgi:hypothetical protein